VSIAVLSDVGAITTSQRPSGDELMTVLIGRVLTCCRAEPSLFINPTKLAFPSE
jgi:hypothetical protein